MKKLSNSIQTNVAYSQLFYQRSFAASITKKLMVMGLLFLIMIYLFSCKPNDNVNPPNKNGGFAKVELNVDPTVTLASAKTEGEVDVSNFLVETYHLPSYLLENTYTFNQIPAQGNELIGGDYLMIAYSNDGTGHTNNFPAAFDNPYYRGYSNQFTIIPLQSTPVSIGCTLSNAVCSIAFSQKVHDLCVDWSASVSNVTFPGLLSWTMNDSITNGHFKDGYFQTETHNPLVDINTSELSISVALTYLRGGDPGQPVNITASGTINAVSKHKYNIYIDITGEIGWAKPISITVDDTTIDVPVPITVIQ